MSVTYLFFLKLLIDKGVVMKQEDCHNFKASLSYLARLSKKKNVDCTRYGTCKKNKNDLKYALLKPTLNTSIYFLPNVFVYLI